jgi:hypothetical protein
MCIVTSMYYLFRFVECESKNSGLIAPLQALSIVKLHMSKNQKLICDLLQAVAEKDSSHPLVRTEMIYCAALLGDIHRQ